MCTSALFMLQAVNACSELFHVSTKHHAHACNRAAYVHAVLWKLLQSCNSCTFAEKHEWLGMQSLGMAWIGMACIRVCLV